MTAIDDIRTGNLNAYLHRTDGSSKPWGDTELNQQIVDAITKLWPKTGAWTTDDVASSSTSMIYAVPAAFGTFFRISRIDIVDDRGMYVDRATNWRKHTEAEVIVKPLIGTGVTLRFYGWIPFSVDGTDLPGDLVETVAHRAASRAYGSLAAELINSERQQNLDAGRVVSYADAIGLSAYHERLFQDGVNDHPSKVSYAPRRAHR